MSPLRAKHQREVVRLHAMWKEAQTELHQTRGELELYASSPAPDDAELQLQNERERMRALSRSNAALKRQLAEVEGEVAESLAIRTVEAEELHALRNQALALSGEKQHAVEKALGAVRDRDAQLKDWRALAERRALEAAQIRKQLESVDGQLTGFRTRIKGLEVELDTSRRSHAELRTRSLAREEQFRESLDVSRGMQQREAFLQERNREILEDNARLLKLLSRTEYRHLSEDATASGGLSFVPPAMNPPCAQLHGHRSLPAKRRVGELAKWVPQEAAEVALAFQLRNPELKSEEIRSTMLTLNKVWRKRESGKLVQLAAKHEAHLVDIRRQIRQRVPMDQIVLRPRTMDVVDGGSPERARRPKSAAKFYVDSADYDQMLGGDGADRAGRSGKEDEAFFQGAVWLGYRSVEHADRLGAKVQDAAQRYADARGAGLRPEELLTVADSAIGQMDAAVLKARTRVRRLFDGALERAAAPGPPL